MDIKRLFGLGLVLLPQLSAAQPPTGQDLLYLQETSPNAFVLRAKNARLASVLAEIAAKTKVTLHYTALSNDKVSLTCQGIFESILACVLRSDANIAIRYSSYPRSKSTDGHPTEAWILQPNQEKTQGNLVSQAKEHSIDTTDHVAVFLEQAKDPALRMQAIANLGMEANKGNRQVRVVLNAALQDKNPGVRSQAILALRQTNDETAMEQIQAATHDGHADVRAIAIESLGDNQLVLQDALKDSNENIRQYAANKLASLNTNN